MPRVLSVLNRLVVGGPAAMAVALAKGMAPEWDTQLVIGGKDDGELDATHLLAGLDRQPIAIPEMRRAISPGRDWSAYRAMRRIIADFRPDIVHTHAAKSGAIGRMAAHHAGVPVVVHTFHGHVFHSYFSPAKTRMYVRIEQALARRSHGIIALSHSQKHDLTEVYHICPPAQVRVIPLGISARGIGVDEERKRQAFRTRYGVKDNEVAIGIIGRIVPVKNHALFVEAAKLLAARHPHTRFFIIGDGEDREAVEAAVQAAGLSYAYQPADPTDAQVVCTSWVTAVDEPLAGLDIVALTSHNEGTPVSLIEAQAAARPIASTAVGGVEDVVENGVTGLLTPPDSAEAFADALAKLVESAETRAGLGIAGRARFEAHFREEGMVQGTADYFAELLRQRSAR